MDITDYLRFVFALGFVIGLFGLFVYLAKRYGLGYRRHDRTGKRRLSVSESMPLDGKRRLILVRRDDYEHLVLIGGESDLVIEAAIPTSDTLPFHERLHNTQTPPAPPARPDDTSQEDTP